MTTPTRTPLVTPWADQVDRNSPLPEYPRPQLVRERWTNLNGVWDYAIAPREQAAPEQWQGEIVVPFPVESHISGVGQSPGPGGKLWYKRKFAKPKLHAGERVLLHFGAVDWQATVSVNGHALGVHEGGHDPFSFDITNVLREGEEQELMVAVWDPTDAGAQPRGKQSLHPQAIWYLPVTGIWQTVWLEVVPAAYIHGLQLTPEFDRSSVRVAVNLRGPRADASLNVRILAEGQLVAEQTLTEFDSLIDFCKATEIRIPAPRHWSPDSPFLYDVELTYRSAGQEDKVRSYFGIRKVEVRKAADGFERIFLNNEPLFLYGPLDQGWWPDGLYTAPTDEALRWDIEITKAMGFNMTRKHIKVEPARWYYHCDRIGLVVWQDMPSSLRSGDPGHVPPRLQPLDGVFTAEDDAQFRAELRAMIDALRHFPCITSWVTFNECWGQHSTNNILAWVRSLDTTRMVNGPSGWNDLGYGDTIDKHDYPGPGMWPPQPGRASVLGEFGGLGLPVPGHLWQEQANWGYRDSDQAEDLVVHYDSMLRHLRPLIHRGLAAAVYTQLTDVEGEVNGMITYDRKVLKITAEKLAELHLPLTTSIRRD
jgi:beta-galactosidase/beta-glucuronidase